MPKDVAAVRKKLDRLRDKPVALRSKRSKAVDVPSGTTTPMVSEKAKGKDDGKKSAMVRESSVEETLVNG